MNFLIKSENEYANPESFLKDYGCYRLSKYIEIHTTGHISICCHSWLPVMCGNIITDSIDEILNNADRQQMITDMDSGKFTNCNDHCPSINARLNNRIEPANFIVPLNRMQAYKKAQPTVINFSYDQSCNLQCPSCRDRLILHKEGENTMVDNIHAGVVKLVDYFIERDQPIILNITGSGDAFASPTYWKFLKELSLKNLNHNIKLKLMTNGILMTAEKWEEIKPLWGNIVHIGVSIDAVYETTYNIVRKNGSKTKLDANLTVLDNMVKNNKFKNLSGWQTNFTVQKQNYKEIKEYVEWQLTYSTLSVIFFNLIAQWGHLPNNLFANMNLNSDDQANLRTTLADPIFSNNKIQLGNLNIIKDSNEKN